MSLHRVFAVVAVIALGPVAPSLGQEKPQEKGGSKLSKAEMSHYQALNALVDAVAGAKEPAPADVKLTFQNHFVRSALNVFVPYVLEISGGTFESFPVAMYVRAVRKPVAGEPPASDYAFTDLHFFDGAKRFVSTGPNAVQVVRAMELPPGEFDLYFALAETPARNGKTSAKRVVHTQSVTVPDLSKGLTTSSVILAKSMEEAPQPPTPREQMEQPYTIGGQRITPNFDAAFPKAGELLFLYLVYNEGATSGDKPDLDVNYTLFRGSEPKPFGKLPLTSFNATTLPAEFKLSAGHQVLAAQGFPLATFAPGPYRLEIGITDKVSNQTISRTVPFSVTP